MNYPIALLAAMLFPVAQVQVTNTPPTPAEMTQHQVERYTTLLSLTAEQQETATSIFTAATTTEQPLRASERTAHETLQAAIKANQLSIVRQSATTLGQLDGELLSTRAVAEAKFYATLTENQKAKFTELERGHGRGGPGGGPDGPPPPPQ